MRSSSEVDVAAAYAAHRLALVRLAVLLVDDQAAAEDVVQDAFIGLHRHRGNLREPAAVFGYLRTSVVNNAHAVLRKRQVARKHQFRSDPETGDGSDIPLVLAEEHREVLAAVRTLPPRQREVVVLRYWSGLSEAEIANTLGVSRGAVKSQASRALDKLQATLEALR